MSSHGIEFREGTATQQDIQAHLEACDTDFSPNLSLKVDIGEYSRKIRARARTFEAWSGKRLVGLVAAYMNDHGTRIGFITSVSVAKEFEGRGIASVLIDHSLNKAWQEGMAVVRLEVSLETPSAIRLYQHFGFSEISRKGQLMAMELALSEKRRS